MKNLKIKKIQHAALLMILSPSQYMWIKIDEHFLSQEIHLPCLHCWLCSTNKKLDRQKCLRHKDVMSNIFSQKLKISPTLEELTFSLSHQKIFNSNKTNLNCPPSKDASIEKSIFKNESKTSKILNEIVFHLTKIYTATDMELFLVNDIKNGPNRLT